MVPALTYYVLAASGLYAFTRRPGGVRRNAQVTVPTTDQYSLQGATSQLQCGPGAHPVVRNGRWVCEPKALSPVRAAAQSGGRLGRLPRRSSPVGQAAQSLRSGLASLRR